MTQFSQFLNQFGLLTLPLWIKRENVSLFQAGKIRTLKDLFFISFATLCQAESILCDQINEMLMILAVLLCYLRSKQTDSRAIKTKIFRLVPSERCRT